MRIGIDVSKALGVSDGIGIYSRQITTAMASEGVEHEFFLYDLRHSEIDPDRCQEMLPDLAAYVKTVSGREPVEGELDVFFCPAFKVPRLKELPLVLTLHDVTFVSHPQYHTLGNRVEVLAETTEALLRGAVILAVSQATKREAETWLGIDPDNMTVVYEAADEAFKPPGGATREIDVFNRLNLDRPYVLTVGSIEPRKNLRGLLDAFAELDTEVRDRFAMVVVGAAGWRNEAIHRRMVELSYRLNVVFAGAVSREELIALYGNAAAFAYPSFAEGFGLPVVEAMACGAPVITSGCSSMLEVAGEAALLIDPADTSSLSKALQELLSDEALRTRLSAAAISRAATFSWARAARETLTLLQRVGLS
jgi:glycosyltransferase involved in cell wall biosynthesis